MWFIALFTNAKSSDHTNYKHLLLESLARVNCTRRV